MATTSPKMKERLFKEIKENFDFEDKGEMKYFLGVNIKRDRVHKRLSLDMRACIQDKINSFGLADLKPVTTPWHSTDPKDMGAELNEQDTTLFRAMIGSLLWVALVRPDVSQAVDSLP